MLTGTIVRRSELSPVDIRRMHALMVGHYDNVVHGKFLADLDEKDGCLLVRDRAGTLQGFSTFYVRQGAGHRILFSGDTIVDARSWGRIETLRTLGRLFGAQLAEPGDPLYWLLLSKGVRTYLLLPLLFRTFAPGGSPARDLSALLRHLAVERYGAAYDPATSVYRSSADRLKSHWARVSDGRLADPHVREFLARNPGHVRGDELVSLAPIAYDNLTPAGRRLVEGR